MRILGISCYYHDSAAALLHDGVLIAAAEEERFSRKKHDASFPKRAIAFCLKKADMDARDLDYVVFYEKPFVKFERLLLTSLSFAPHSFNFFKESMKTWFFDHLWIKNHIIRQLSIDAKKLLFCEHHLSHAASAFFCSPYKKSAIMTLDGVGEWTTATWGIGTGNRIDLKEEIRFPHSLGLLYSVFTDFVGFEVNEGEYKVMGLAPYGKPHYVAKIHKVLHVANDGSFSVDLSYFSYYRSVKELYTKKFYDLFGTPKKSGDDVVQYYADIAASLQYVLEETLLKLARYIYKKTNLDTLCYAGGVALNSKANWLIQTKTPFTNIYIQPAAGDSGGAVGAALWVYCSVLGRKRDFVMEDAYWGAQESKEEIEAFLRAKHIRYRKILSEDRLIDEVTDALTKGGVIGWVQGRFEWGPRSLGHRSILADPRKHAMKDLVNSKIKFREGFRPFAPSVVSENADEYFSLGEYGNNYPLHFMLYVVPVQQAKQSQLGAVTHVDGTARPQVVHKHVNPRYHKLITAFGQKTGVPVVLNTSFNLKGEPIVNTAKEAYDTFMRSGLDTLVLGSYIITK